MFDAERWLGSLNPIGWRFGLMRIRALLRELDDPQDSFESIHVVGTNGKSSVTAMTAALLEAGGLVTGSYQSPHTRRWSQRVRARGLEIDAAAFARAAERVADAVAVVEAGFEAGERVTQFEAATATAFVGLEWAGVGVGVIEAGLGGRLDATNVLRSRATALTSVGLDHTAWLGESEAQIAAEKLAVLREGSTLVVGDLPPDVSELARRTAAKRGCRIVEAGAGPQEVSPATPYLRRNLGVAIAAAEVVGPTLSPDRVRAAVQGLRLPGRFEVVPGEPPVVMDAAHNPDGARALAEALAAHTRAPVVACLAILADKDAAGIVAALAPALSTAVCTEIPPARLAGAGRPGASAVPAAELATICRAAGVAATSRRNPRAAIAFARALAGERGGVALLAGSHYLLGYEWTGTPAQSC